MLPQRLPLVPVLPRSVSVGRGGQQVLHPRSRPRLTTRLLSPSCTVPDPRSEYKFFRNSRFINDEYEGMDAGAEHHPHDYHSYLQHHTHQSVVATMSNPRCVAQLRM